MVTERDLEVIKGLLKYGSMSTAQIEKLYFEGRSYEIVRRRLNVLEDAGHVRRTSSGWFKDHVWWLTEKGASLVSKNAPRKKVSRFTLEHDVMVIDLRIKLEDCRIAKHWLPEHEIKSRMTRKYGINNAKRKVVPDGIMGVEMGDLKESIAIELELHAKSSIRYKMIFNDYQFKENLYAVWYLVPTASLGRSIEKEWYKTCFGNYRVKFYWSVVSEVLRLGPEAVIRSQNKSHKLYELFLQNQYAEPPIVGVVPYNREIEAVKIESPFINDENQKIFVKRVV
jgi:hypothetical protein